MPAPFQTVLSDWTQAQQAVQPQPHFKRDYNKLNDKYDTWKTGLSDAESRARSQTAAILNDMGYTPEQYAPLLDTVLSNALYGVNDPGDPSAKFNAGDKFKYRKAVRALTPSEYTNLAAPNTIFDPDSLASTIQNRISIKQAHAPDSVTGLTQQQALKQYTDNVNSLHSQYDPYKLFGTVDSNNAAIQSILGTGYNDVLTQVENAFKRGTLTDVGKQRAVSELGNQRTAGAQLLTQNANDINSKNRQSISDLLGKADSGLDAFKATNTPFNFDSIATQLSDTASNLQSGFEGSLRNSATGQQFFDATKAINLGGGVQGGINPITRQTDSLAGAISNLSKKNSQPRTLGNSGAF